MTTRYPARRRACAAWLPMYPAPPVTRTVDGSVAANGVIDEPALLHLLGREQVAAVAHDGRSHQLQHLFEIGAPELVPFGHDRQAVGALERVVILVRKRHAAAEDRFRDPGGLRIVCLDGSARRQQRLDQ